MTDETQAAPVETGAPADTSKPAATVETQKPSAEADAAKGPAAEANANDPFAELETDTREWLSKREVKDAKAAAKLAHEQSKLLGNAIRIPGKDAKPEEIEAYREKLGVPKSKDDYAFEVPKDLPPELPYDAERATGFKELAHSINLTKEQAKAIHDWAATSSVGDFNTAREAENARKVETAKGETAKLVKLWGPLDGETMKANLSFADKVLTDVGGAEAIEEFKRVGLIGEGAANKIILSAPIATMLAKLGTAVYREGEILKGNPDRLNNPFAEGASFNMTDQMRMIKSDPETARSLALAAGKRPEDLGF